MGLEGLEDEIDPGHTAFMFMSTGLVQFMTPGLGFFYGGLVRKKNVLAMIMQSYIAMGVITLLWFTVAFSLCFGDTWGWCGSPFTYLLFVNVPIHGPLMRDGVAVSAGIPGTVYAAYQCTFAIITPPLMSGTFADRFHFWPYTIFISLWILTVYSPICHWIWGGGWIAQLGVVEWAGGMVVHTISGFSALSCLVFVGRRYQLVDGKPTVLDGSVEGEPHNVPLIALGTAMIWFGWYGFNGGSSFLSNGAGMLATLNSQLAAGVAAVTWMVCDYVGAGKKPSLVNFCVGGIAGLVAITPAAGYVQTGNAVLLGAVAAPWCWSCVKFSKKWMKFGFEDALDIWGVHGMGGFLGTVSTGLLADGAECADIKTAPLDCANPGIVTRSMQQLMLQLGAASFCALYSLVVSYGLLVLITRMMPIVASPEQQLDYDQVEHGEQAYILGADDEPLKDRKWYPGSDQLKSSAK